MLTHMPNTQARISLRAGGAAARGPVCGGGPDLKTFYQFFKLVLKISPAAPFSELPYHENFVFFPKNFACGAF
jgi:hypothetical protein